MTAAAAAHRGSANHRKVGPYSRMLRRGAIGASIDGRSTLGRFIRDLEQQLISHVGGAPSITQRLLIDRTIKVTVQLDALDRKLMAADGWNEHDGRTHNALINRQRLLLRELGIDRASAPESVDDLLRGLNSGSAS
ncbi:MAG TPA: hypothetical protein VMF05_05980 [Stellaceae bacterium]|nr:hypothetical protein [Stellaceae bacterium]